MDLQHDVLPRTSRPVMVGVDGSPTSLVAARWAAWEAQLRRTTLRVVHVLPTQESTTGAEAILTVALATVRETHPDLAVDTMTFVGEVSESLTDLTPDSSVLVLGVDAGRSRSQHGVIGPVEERIAAHSWCPTVWVSRLLPMIGDTRVLAILPSTAAGMDVLATAAVEAHLRSAELHVLIDPVSSGSGTDDLVGRTLIEIESAHPGLKIIMGPARPLTDDQILNRIGVHRIDELLELVILAGPRAHDRWSLRTGHLGPALAHNGDVPVMYIGMSSVAHTQFPATLAGPPTASAPAFATPAAGPLALP